MASMAHPVFSLTTKPDVRELVYKNGNAEIKITPSYAGLPTVFDRDVLIYVISQLMAKKNRGEPIGPNVQFRAHDLLVTTNRPTNNLGYERLEAALTRLAGTFIKTTIRTGDVEDIKGFHLVEGFNYRRKGQLGSDRLGMMEVALPDWLFRAIEHAEVLPISRDYFRLRRAIDRRLYDIARKYCGAQKAWTIGLDKLQVLVGSKRARRNFVGAIREAVKSQHLPDYTIDMAGEKVTFRRRAGGVKPTELTVDTLDMLLSADALEKARAIASGKGWDFYALKGEFIGFMESAGKPNNISGAFLNFVKKKKAQPGYGQEDLF